MNGFARFALTAGGLGLLWPAPGTWGSLPPVALALGMATVGCAAWQVNLAVILLGLAGAVATVRFGGLAEAALGKKDPGAVVSDEVAGQAIALVGLPWSFGGTATDAAMALTAFLAFRAMDIAKPPPARRLQDLKGGVGILVDDLVAGIYAAIVTQLVWRVAVQT